MPVNENEITRTREHGTEVTNTKQTDNPGMARIEALRRIVVEKQYAKIDGVMIDLFSASTMLAVYDAINESNQTKFRNLPISRMAGIAFKVLK